MKREFKFRGWSILGIINTYLGWRYNRLIVIKIDIGTGKSVDIYLKDASEYDKMTGD